MGEEQNVLEIKELKSYFYTEKGVLSRKASVSVELRIGATIGALFGK